MKKRNQILAFAAFTLIAGNLIAQQSTKSPKKPQYDAKLAKKLGADRLGMKHYFLAILKTRPTVVARGKE